MQQLYSHAKLCNVQITASSAMPKCLHSHQAIVLKCLTNKIKLTWTTTPLVAKGCEAGGLSGEWGLLQANCLDLINQSHWTIQMKTNGLGCLQWLPRMQQCMGRSSMFGGLQLKMKNKKTRNFYRRLVSKCTHSTATHNWSIVKLRQSWLVNCISRSGKWFFMCWLNLAKIATTKKKERMNEV